MSNVRKRGYYDRKSTESHDWNRCFQGEKGIIHGTLVTIRYDPDMKKNL